MTKNFKTLILLLCIAFNAKGQTLSTVVNDKEIVDFFSWRINQNSGNRDHNKVKRINKAKIKIALSDITESDMVVLTPYKKRFMDSLLTEDDKLFIISQIDTSKTTWTNSVFTNTKLIIPKDIMKIGKNDDYYEFSQPLFTKDLKRCFLNQAYHCGFMCSDWSTLLFEKIANGEWKLVMTISALSS